MLTYVNTTFYILVSPNLKLDDFIENEMCRFFPFILSLLNGAIV
jgi:hypothetical protein